MDLDLSATDQQLTVDVDGRTWLIEFTDSRWRWKLLALLDSLGLGEHESGVAMRLAEQLWRKTF